MKRDERGSTLITVVVGVSFLMILAAVLLSTSSAGLRMKQMEYAAARSHYSDEQILDDVYNGIGKVSTQCLSKAYAQILSQVSDASNPVYTTQGAAYQAFSRRFMDLLLRSYPECGTADTSYETVLQTLQNYVTAPPQQGQITGFRKIERVYDKDGVTPYQLAFRDVTLRYATVDAGGAENGFESFITTDIVVEVPYLNFFQDSSRVMDYALIANQGIYFDNAAVRTVDGNVYAGSSDSEPPGNLTKYRNEGVYGGLNFFDSDVTFCSPYLISKGDINVRKSSVTVDNSVSSARTQVWAESIRTVENLDKSKPAEPSQLTVHANVYAANDLELNARESDVTLAGEYYGYNNGTYATQEKKQLEGGYESSAHTGSSAIIINGSRSQLDLSALSTMVVTGYAYVDLQSRAYSGLPGAGGGNPAGRADEFATGESLALKSNQYMYLAPTSCLNTTNPVETDEAPAADDVWRADSTWFGMTGGFMDMANPVTAKVVLNRTTGVAYTYYYLHFLPQKEELYAGTVLNMQNPAGGLAGMDSAVRSKYGYDSYNEVQLNQIWELKQSLEQKATEPTVAPVIVLADHATASIYGQGVISSADGSSLGSQETDGGNALALDSVTKMKSNMPRHYEWLYTELNPMEQFALTSDALMTPPELGQSNMPAAKFVDFTRLSSNAAGGTTYRYRQNRDYRTVLRNGSYTVPAGHFEGIIICNGDVVISPGADVEGLVIAGGRIYVKGNGSIAANRSIVQSILEEEMTEESKQEAGTPERTDYALYVLKDFTPSHVSDRIVNRVTGTEYTDYISYQNWRKGEGN